MALFNVDGEIFAIKRRLPAQGRAPRRRNAHRLDRRVPMHGWTFDVTTGQPTIPVAIRWPRTA